MERSHQRRAGSRTGTSGLCDNLRELFTDFYNRNRCCDQCRKGKRACDAAILEDALLEDNKTKSQPTSFHYSGELHMRDDESYQN